MFVLTHGKLRYLGKTTYARRGGFMRERLKKSGKFACGEYIYTMKTPKGRRHKPSALWHPQRESNSQLTLRRGLLYPFNYGGV